MPLGLIGCHLFAGIENSLQTQYGHSIPERQHRCTSSLLLHKALSLPLFSPQHQLLSFTPILDNVHGSILEVTEQFSPNPFSIDMFTMKRWDELHDVPIADIKVIGDVRLVQTGMAESKADFVALQEWLDVLPPKKQSSTKAEKGSVKQHEPAVLEHLRFLTAFVQSRSSSSGSIAQGSDMQGDAVAVASDEDSELDDETAEAVFKHLEAARKECASSDNDVVDKRFNVVLLGGPWLYTKTGRAYDAFKGKAKKDLLVEEWCNMYGLKKSFRADTNMFGMYTASVLAQAWCHKMEYLFELFIVSGSLHYSYSAADLAAYQEPEECTANVRHLTGNAADRVCLLRELAPR